MEDSKFKDEINPLDHEELENVSGGDGEYIPDIIFGVDVINGTTNRREIFDTPQYYQIETLKNWIRKRENLDACTIRIYNQENVELVDGSFRANNIKTGDVLTAIVN